MVFPGPTDMEEISLVAMIWEIKHIWAVVVIIIQALTPVKLLLVNGWMMELYLCTGEWWKDNMEIIVKQSKNLGLAAQMSDAHNINANHDLFYGRLVCQSWSWLIMTGEIL